MTWLAPGGGVDQGVYTALKHLATRYDFDLAVGREIHRNDFADVPGVTVYVCPHLGRAVNPWQDVRALLWFARLIRRGRYDLIHTHETKASVLSRIAARLAGHHRVIYGLHGVCFNDPVSPIQAACYRVMERATMRAADFIVSVSRDAIEQYHAAGIGTHLPYAVIYSPVDIDDFTRRARQTDRGAMRDALGVPRDAAVLINIGRFSRAKAQRYAVEALFRVRQSRRDAVLVLVGEGPEREACTALARRLGVQDFLVFTGFRADVPEVLAAADVHVLTSFREGLPRVAVEASLAAIPTVSFEVDGIREIVSDGSTGYVVPRPDVAALTERILTLLRRDDVRQRMGQAAWAHAAQGWNHQTSLERLDATYQALLAS